MFRVIGVDGLDDVLFSSFVDCLNGVLELSVGVWDYGVEVEIIKNGEVMSFEEFNCLVDVVLFG